MLDKLRHSLRAAAALPAGVRLTALAAVALLWAFWPTFTALADRWGTESRYSHGYLVPLFAAYLLWARRGLCPAAPAGAPAWGLALLAAGLGLRWAGTFY